RPEAERYAVRTRRVRRGRRGLRLWQHAGIDLFFFQAEDGIRDGHVTGVQTCALPISARPGARGEIAAPGDEDAVRVLVVGTGDRSEERRVGKECRSRWAAHQ